MNAKERSTIRDVSRLAGVSISSVSRALNGATTNEELIARVMAAVEATGYVPSALAQSFQAQQVGQIAFAVEDIGNPAYLSMVRVIQPVLAEAGLRLTLISTDGVVAEEIDVVRSLRQRFVDGLIICPIRPTEELLAELEGAAQPVVVIGGLPREVPLDNIRGDSRLGARMAVEHLLQSGARRIGLVSGPLDTVPGRARHEGFIEALAKAGAFDPELVVLARSFQFADGLAPARHLLDRGVDAVLGSTDRLAVSALHAAHDLGLGVPHDVKIVGIDNSEVAQTALPSLTSVDLGAEERGRLAAEMLISRLRDPQRPPRLVRVAPRLVLRGSTA